MERRRKKSERHGAHGGSWKIAYADFITTMMAFFLLLWLLSIITTEQKKGVSDYFQGVISLNDAPDKGHEEKSTLDEDKEKKQNKSLSENEENTHDSEGSDSGQLNGFSDAESAEEERRGLGMIEQSLINSVKDNEEIRPLADQMVINRSEEGLKIQIIDQEGRPLFDRGSADMLDHTKKILMLVTEVLKKAPNNVSISGHTDATPFSRGEDYGNWELSIDRANACRREMEAFGFPSSRIISVVGRESHDPLLLDDPDSPKNRRICITLLKKGVKK